MKKQKDFMPESAAAPAPCLKLVSIYVSDDHPLLRLKRSLDWEKIKAVMIKHWRQAGKNVDGGPGLPWPVDLYSLLLVLMSVKTLHSREMEKDLEENVVSRLFLDLEDQLSPHVRDHSNIARAQETLGVEGWREVNELVVGRATELGFGQPEILSSDTSVQEPAIGYPHEAGILNGVAQRVYRGLVKLKEKSSQAIESGKEKAKEIFKTVKEYHLFAKTQEKKDELLNQLVEQTKELMADSREVIKQVGRTGGRVTQSVVLKLRQMVEVSEALLPQILQWLQTRVVATGKILHAGITRARAIVKNKAGKRVEFGLKWLINRIEGGYVFGREVEARADERVMPIEAMKDYQRVFGAEAAPKMMVYDRGGSAPEDDRGIEAAGSGESRHPAARQSQMVRCRGRPNRSAIPTWEDGRCDRHAQESEIQFQSQAREKQSNVNCRRAEGDGLSEFEPADERHRGESEESKSSDNLKQEEAGRNERSEEKGKKDEKEEEVAGAGWRNRKDPSAVNSATRSSYANSN
jgi:hypothetical protein